MHTEICIVYHRFSAYMIYKIFSTDRHFYRIIICELWDQCKRISAGFVFSLIYSGFSWFLMCFIENCYRNIVWSAILKFGRLLAILFLDIHFCWHCTWWYIIIIILVALLHISGFTNFKFDKCQLTMIVCSSFQD